MQKSESIAELAKSLAKVHAEISNPKKTSNNPFFKSKYADLSEVINVSKPVLSANGLSVVQLPSFKDGIASVETILLHESSEYISSEMSMPVCKQDAQSIGSVITYIRRYALAAICGLAQEDDDAEAAMTRKTDRKPANNVVVSLETLNQAIETINNHDSNGFGQVWSELERLEKDALWKKLNTQEKQVAKDLLDEFNKSE